MPADAGGRRRSRGRPGPFGPVGRAGRVAWTRTRPRISRQVPGIDAILAGHAHLVFPDPSFADLPGVDIARGTINGVPTVMAGFWGSHLGVVDLTLRRTRGAAGSGSTGRRRRVASAGARTTNGSPRVEPDPGDRRRRCKPSTTGTLAYVRRPVARSTARIHSYFALVQDDPSVQLVARAQTAYIRRVLQGTSTCRRSGALGGGAVQGRRARRAGLLHRRAGGRHRHQATSPTSTSTRTRCARCA